MSEASKTSSQKLPGKSVLIIGVAATAGALAATLLARLVIGLFVPLDPLFPPFSYGSIAFFTILFCLIGVGIYALINRLAKNPLRTFNIVAVIGLFISILPDLAGMANPAGLPFPGGSVGNFAILIFFHVVAAVAFLWVLNSMAKRAG